MKKKVEKVESVSEEKVCTEACSKKIAKLDIDFGRVDLNLLRDKINEIIECQ